jgi:hypothetical protein
LANPARVLDYSSAKPKPATYEPKPVNSGGLSREHRSSPFDLYPHPLAFKIPLSDPGHLAKMLCSFYSLSLPYPLHSGSYPRRDGHGSQYVGALGFFSRFYL